MNYEIETIGVGTQEVQLNCPLGSENITKTAIIEVIKKPDSYAI